MHGLRNKMEKLDGKSMDIVEQNVEQLKELFPEVFSEGKIKFDQLQELLGNYVLEGEDHYNFTWHGKHKAGRLAQIPSTGTLRPCKEESVDWDSTQNLFIEGDNLEVLKLLQKSYHRQVKMIYIDPPYNTGNDFVYEDDFKDGVKNYLEMTGQIDSEGKKMGTNSSAAGRYHTNWLNMMYPRLKLARNLMRDDGVIFISIDDNEQANLKKLCDEIFGEENFRAAVSWQKKYSVSNNFKGIASVRDVILTYSKSDNFQNGFLPRSKESAKRYQNPDNDHRGPWKPVDYWNIATVDQRPNCVYPITNPNTKKEITPTKKSWKYERATHEKHVAEDRIYWGKDGTNEVPALKLFLSEVRDGLIPHNWWPHTEVSHTDEAKKYVDRLFNGISPFDTPKPLKLIERMLQISSVEAGDIVLDFFAGSASTAEACLKYDEFLKFVMIQIPERCVPKSEGEKQGYKNIAEISKERIRRAAKKIKEENPGYKGDLGFKVFKLDGSNIKRWEAGFDTLEQDLLNAVDYIKQDRSSEDVLYELLLKYGLDLTVPIETRTIAGKTVYSIGLGALVVCLDKDVSMDVVNGIGELKEELQPEIMRVVFKDDGFKDDVVKTNALQTLKRYGVEDIKSL